MEEVEAGKLAPLCIILHYSAGTHVSGCDTPVEKIPLLVAIKAQKRVGGRFQQEGYYYACLHIQSVPNDFTISKRTFVCPRIPHLIMLLTEYALTPILPESGNSRLGRVGCRVVAGHTVAGDHPFG
jgi:hypothetical protein